MIPAYRVGKRDMATTVAFVDDLRSRLANQVQLSTDGLSLHVDAVEKYSVAGNPDMDRASTSYVERQNLTMRVAIRRMTRLTNASSKKPRNHRAAVALHFAHYNLVRRRQTLRVTPAMAAGVETEMWSMDRLLDAALAPEAL